LKKALSHDEVEKIARSALAEDEQLVWCDAPDPRASLIQHARIAIFGSGVGFLALWWLSRLTDHGIPDLTKFHYTTVFILVSFFLLLIGLAMMSVPLVVHRNARRTVYALTDRRCMIVRLGKVRRIRSYTREDIGKIEWMIGPRGKDNVIFGTPEATVKKGGTPFRRAGFYTIPDAKTVEQRLREVFRMPEEAA